MSSFNQGSGRAGVVLGKHVTQTRYVGSWKHSGPVLKKFGKKEQARAAERAAKCAAPDPAPTPLVYEVTNAEEQ